MQSDNIVNVIVLCPYFAKKLSLRKTFYKAHNSIQRTFFWNEWYPLYRDSTLIIHFCLMHWKSFYTHTDENNRVYL